MKKTTIVIVEDEADLVEVIRINLQAEGYQLLSFADGDSGLRGIREAQPDLVLLDIMLPELDGIEVCRQLKSDKRTESIPVVMLTAKGTESDAVLGLGIGADDYVRKPFRIAELIARIKAVLRRTDGRQSKTDVLTFGPLRLDNRQHRFFISDKTVELTATEFRLLAQLMGSPGSVFSRELLIDGARGEDVFINERTIDTHLSSVRRKLGPYRDAIRTVWGVGYRFEAPQEDELYAS